MPIYTFVCEKCGLESVEVVRFGDPLPYCPYCHLELKRQYSGNVSFIFKGSGFFETDYKKHTSKSKGVK